MLVLAGLGIFYLSNITSTPLHIEEGKKVKYIEIVSFKGHDVNYKINISNIEEELVKKINEVRIKNGAKPLTLDTSLCYVARNYSKRMLTYNFFAHVDPYTGLDALGRLKKNGILYPSVGENLAFIEYNQKDYPVVDKVIELWMDSPPHKATMLSNKYSLLGVGVYCEKGKCYITSLYASPTITKNLSNTSKDKLYLVELIPEGFQGSTVNVELKASADIKAIIVPKREDAKAIADLMPHSEIWRNTSTHMSYAGFLPSGAALVVIPLQDNTSVNINLTYRVEDEG